MGRVKTGGAPLNGADPGVKVDHSAAQGHVRPMQNRGVWLAFLTMCFALTGMVGLFASYATSIPLERALHRHAVLDQAQASGQPDPAAIRSVMGRDAAGIIDGPGDLPARMARARAIVASEAADEERIVATRTRLMVGIVTLLSAGVGAGILLLASRPARH